METFKETGLKPEILRAISEMGFEKPTPIQEKTIPSLLESKTDLVALAQTGTGKTAAFGLPILHLIQTRNSNPQALVLCPTRELCMQITKDITNFSKYLQGFTVVAVYGGASIVNQMKDLKRGADIVVGTPGRLMDLIRRKVLKLNQIQWLVLDEADEMLNMGFKEDIDTILAETPKERQTLLFSATMPSEIERISKKYMKNPEKIEIGQRNAGAENVKHEYFVVHAKDRYETLKRLADINPDIYGIVFCRTRHETKEVADKLMQDGYNADALHGDLSQAQRDYVMNRFRLKHLQILVATDVAARGLDVNDLTHVINYDLPDDLDVYVHRSGRTGRAGKSGIALSIIHLREIGKMRELERITRKNFERKQVPGGREICEKQLFKLVDKVEKIEFNDNQIDSYLPVIYKKLEWLSREDLIKHFVSVEFNRFLEYYKNAVDLNVQIRDKSNFSRERDSQFRDRDRDRDRDRPFREKRERFKEKDGPKDRRFDKKHFSRFHINVGSKHGLKATGIIGLVNENNPKLKIEIGKIDLMRNFTFFEADKKFEQDILQSFQNKQYGNVDLNVTISKSEGPPKFSPAENADWAKKRKKKKKERS
jgi:ATP-dependent RNA helicase DeaD